MSASNMLTVRLALDSQPGGIPPILHLKQGATGLCLQLSIRTDTGAGTGFTAVANYRAVLKGVRPDRREVFLSHQIQYESAGKSVSVIVDAASEIGALTETAGEYLCELSIFNTAADITRENFSSYDKITVAQFIVAVEHRAAKGG